MIQLKNAAPATLVATMRPGVSTVSDRLTPTHWATCEQRRTCEAALEAGMTFV